MILLDRLFRRRFFRRFMDKKELLSSAVSPSSGGATRSERGEMSPASLHSSHSSGGSSHSIAVPSTSSSSFPPPGHSSPLSPPQSRAPSQRNDGNGVMTSSVHSNCSSTAASAPPAPTLPPRIAASRPSPGGHIGAPLAQREPSAPPLTPDLSGSDTWSSDGGCTTSTSVDTVIGVARGLGGGSFLRPGGPPVCAVYARGTSNGISGVSSSLHHADSSSSCSSDPLLDRLEAVQRDLTDFSIASMESAEPPAKKLKKAEESEKKAEEGPVEVKSEKKQKKKDKKNKNKAQPTVVEKAEDAYVPGALSALFGGADNDAAPKEDIFAKYAGADNGFVDVPTVIGEVQKKADNPEENTRKKQRENRKKNLHDPAIVDERKRTVFVGNLPNDFTRKKLQQLFAECGKIDSVRLRGTVGSKETLSKKTAFLAGKVNENIKSIVGYVKFVSQDTVLEAIKKNGSVIDGHHIRVDGCVDIKNYSRKSTIFVGNLPFEISDDDVIEWAEACVGPVDFVRVIRDRNTGYGRGVGFITFKEDASVAKALSLATPLIGGNEVRLQKVMKKSEKKELRKGDGARKEKRKQKKIDKKKGATAGGKRPHPAEAAPVNPLLGPVKPTKKVQKEIKKRRKMAGPKSLMK